MTQLSHAVPLIVPQNDFYMSDFDSWDIKGGRGGEKRWRTTGEVVVRLERLIGGLFDDSKSCNQGVALSVWVRDGYVTGAGDCLSDHGDRAVDLVF